MKDTTLFYLFIFIVSSSSLLLSVNSSSSCVSSSSPRIRRAQFTNDSYTGYISENLNQQQETAASGGNFDTTTNPELDKWRRNVLSTVTKPSVVIYVRFVDRIKPSLLVYLDPDESNASCSCLTSEQVNLNLLSSSLDYDQDGSASSPSDALFQVEQDSILCVPNADEEQTCLCYFHIKLSDDPMTRDRLNREARDSYKFQVAAFNTTAYINLQILDDNDLEPMFDPTEYSIELTKYTLTERTIIRNQVPQFTQIGRLSASDPDLDANALTRYFLSTPHALFGVDWLTGAIYTKRPITELFEHPNHWSSTLEAKTIDNGLKYSTLNTLIRLNPNITVMNEASLSVAASQLHFNSSLLKQLPKLASFESAQVRVTLVSNLADLYKVVFSGAELDDDVDLVPSSDLKEGLIPFKILRISFKSPFSLPIDPKSNLRLSYPLKLTQISTRSFLISFDPNLEVSESVRIEYCLDSNDVCHPLVDFTFNSTQAIVETLQRTCIARLEATPKQVVRINRLTSLQNLLRVRSTIEPAYCKRLSLFYSHNDSSLVGNIDEKSGLVSLRAYQSGSFLVYPVVYYQNRRFSLAKSVPIHIDVRYSTRFDHLYNILVNNVSSPVNEDESATISDRLSSQVDLIRLSVDLNRTNVLFESNSQQTRIVKMLYCSVNRPLQKCPVYIQANRLEVVPGIQFRSANVLVKLYEHTSNSSRYVNLLAIVSGDSTVVNVEHKDIYPVLIARPSDEEIDSGEFSLAENEHESSCFYVNRTSGSIYMSCLDEEFIQTVLSVTLRRNDIISSANLRVELSRNGESPLVYYPFTESVLDDQKVAEIIKNEEQLNLDSIRSFLYPISTDYDANTTVISLNQSHVVLNWTIEYQLPIVNSRVYRLESAKLFSKSSSVFLIESIDSSYLRLDNIHDGVIYLATDLNGLEKKIEARLGVTETSLTRRVTRHDVNLEIHVNVVFGKTLRPPKPMLKTNEIEATVDRLKLDKSGADFEVVSAFEWTDLSSGVFTPEFEIKSDYVDYDFPFYLQHSRLVFSNSMQRNLKPVYRFRVVARFKPSIKELSDEEDEIELRIRLVNFDLKRKVVRITNDVEVDEKTNHELSIISRIDMSMAISSASLFSYMKSPIIGFVSKKSPSSHYKLLLAEPPTSPSSKKTNKQTSRNSNKNSRSAQSIVDVEQKLLHDNLLRFLNVDESTGALYLNISEQSGLFLYSKWSKLRKFYLYERNLTAKLVRIDVQSDHHVKYPLYIELVFEKPIVDQRNALDFDSSFNHRNRFLINSNNLLNVFRHGDEFLLALSVDENSFTSSAADPIVNLMDYLRTSVMRNRKSALQFETIKDSLSFYLMNQDDSYFSLEGNSSILVTKPNIQFDYEQQSNYHLKILVVQPVETDQQQQSMLSSNDDLIFASNQADEFHYYIDLHMAVRNQIDEPFMCSQPVYTVSIDENEAKPKPIFTVDILDFDSISSSFSTDRYSVQIVSSTHGGLFSASGLTISTTGRKLDREARDRYVLDLKVTDRTLASNSSRQALCRLIVLVNDVNDNRPIVNDIELSLYDRVDLDIPVANAIAIDQDSVSVLTYSVISVRDLEDEATNLDSLFVMNASSGSLFATQPQLPCFDCTIQITYKATDVGQGSKTRVSRKSAIKLHVRKFPSSLMRINPQTSSTEIIESVAKTFTVIGSIESNSTRQLELDEDTKLGEKIHQIRVESSGRLLNAADSIVYFTLVEESNTNGTFYLSNHDGSLYLIKKLTANQRFNLTVLITNWLGQIEYVPVEVTVRDVNDNEPEFESSPVFNVSTEIAIESASGYKVVALTRLYDSDEVDREKLSIKTDACFYLGRGLLIKKQLFNYPLCDSKSLRLDLDPTGLVSATINLDELSRFLHNSTDFFNSRSRFDPSIVFYLDLSARDSSTDLSRKTLSRARFEIVLKRPPRQLVYKKRHIVGINSNRRQIMFGFKQPVYRIELNEVVTDRELIRLGNEFVWTRGSNTSNFYSFKPFELQFESTNNLVYVEPNFGLVYLNETARSEFLIDVEIRCRVLRPPTASLSANDDDVTLYPTTRLIISVRGDDERESEVEALLRRRIWRSNSIEARLAENSPVGSFLNFDSVASLSELLFDETFDLIPKFEYSVVYSTLDSELFEVEPITGVIRAKFEPDFETQSVYDLKLRVCLERDEQTLRCFKHELEIQVKISNRNDNEPRFTLEQDEKTTITLLSPVELFRSMTLFKFNAFDLDDEETDENKLDFELIHAKLGNSSILDWFDLFTSNHSGGIKLTDLGYERLTKPSSNPQETIELIVETSDGLFSNRLSFHVNVNRLDSSSRRTSRSNTSPNHLAPILLNLEVEEESTTSKLLVPSLHQTLTEYLNVEPDSFVAFFDLLNYETEFRIDDDDHALWVRSTARLDREARDNYELFIRPRVLFAAKHVEHMPAQFRVLVKLADVNDNAPKFVGIESLDKTLLWTDFVQSTRLKPVLKIRAVDADLADKLTYHIDYSTTQLDIFQVDEHTGALYVSEQAQEDLDSVWNMHSSNNNLVTRVGILARDTASHETNRTLKLHLVRFVDPHHVVGFEQTRYEFEIVESAVANTTIGFVNSARFFSPSLTARNDSSSIIYELIDGDDLYDEFGLDYETGRLYTRGDLDYELKPNYTLVVRARSAFGGGLSHSNATIHVRVIDCNDNAPRFDRFEYNTSVKENLAPMTKIYRVEARDADSNGSLNSQVRYKLLNQLDLFYIHEKSGWVYNKMPFDSSASSSREYLLKIQAYDIGSVYSPEHKWKAKSLSSVAHLIVHIEESNTERPQFDKSLYTSQIELALNSRGVQFVTKLSAKDTDHSPLSYSIRSPQPWPHNLFSIDSRTGVVYLDVERYNRFSSASNSPLSSVFNLIVSASDSVFTQTARLNVHVRNSAAKSTTLQPPRFYSSLIDLVFVNSTDVRSFLRRHHSRYDEDIIELSIDPSTMFFLDGTRLTLSTVNSHRLNSSQLYQLPLLACSRVHSTLCDQTLLVVNITLAVNHTDDSAAIKPSADSLLTLEDYAKNVGFSYQYGAYTIQQHISAQTQSSSVTNKPINPVDYDYQNIEEDEDIYESNERFYFEFKTISDQQQQQQHHQQSEDLTGGDMKPYKLEFDLVQCVYMQLNLTLSNHSLAKQIRHFSHGKSYLPLTRAQIKTLFSLNRNNGVLSSRKVLNSMLPGVYLFTIALRLANRSTNATSTVEADRTQFKLIILPSTQSIANSNQTSNFYKFDREFYKFKANNLGHVRLINRLKSHANISFSTHKIRFRLIENKFSLRQRSMTIDERTGEIKLNTSMSGEETLETTEDSELVLYALATVDLAPTTRRNASVLNRLEYMCEIYIDRLSDNPLSSSLTSSSSSSTKPPLDTASAATSSVTEMRIVPSLVRLKLEETLERDVALFRFVTLLESVNERRAFIKYQIEGGAEESASFFEVEPKLGWLKLAKELDRRHLSRVVLNVSACIELQCAFSRVEIDVVDVNNHPPRFEQRVQEATIREDSLPGTVVATVLATDADTHSKLEYFILDGDPLNQFAVSSDGKVYTQLMLDRERSSEYYLEIGAFDGKYRSEMHLRVLILDVSDQRPICGPPNVVELNLDENLEIGTAVYTVKATNREENVTRLRYELIGREQVETGADNLVESYLEQIPFTVDESRGIVRVSDVLDYEHAISYEFYIRVCKSDLESDSTKNSRVLLPWTQYCLIRVRVDLNDVNDNAPEFLPSSLNRRVIDLVESSPRGTILTQFSASDADSKLNSVVRYELVDSLNMFEIATKSGLLQLSASRLDREELPESAVNLTVRAYNVADRLSSLYEIEVNVVDLNDNAPRFDRAEYFISVEENLPTGFLLTQITAFDPDVNSTTEYEIVGDDGDSKFVLDKETGKLYLNGSLDYEQKQHYTLTISARDPYLAGEQSTTRLTIDLIDLNDNTPQFDPSTPSHFYVSENTPINTTIYHVMAYDADKSPLNSALSYRLLDDTQRLFGVDSDSGRLYIRDELDYEQLAATNISLTIECSDRGEPERRRAQLAINIVVLDVNDNAPQFERPNQTIIFKETFPIGQEITRFKVFDRDATEANRGPFTFELVDFDRRDSAFGVTANGSLVLTKRPLRNVTHFVKVRCHDSGSPQSLYTDSHLTIKITDESSNEPHVSDTQIEIVTLENTLSNHIKSGQILGQIRAWDADKQDTLYYELDSNRAIDDHTSESSTKTLEIDRLTGLLKSTRPVEKSTNIRLKTIVTDTKFISEANLNVNVRAIHSQCLLNSLYVKFAHEKSDSTFIQLGYIRRLKEVLSRLMSSQLRISSANATRYDIIVLAMRDQELDSTALEGLDLDDDIEPQSDNGDMNGGGEGKIITEVLFSVTKFGPQSSHCLNSKQVAKLLNKRKPMLLKRLKTGDVKSSSSFKQIKLVDLSFNHECANSQSSDAKICTTNMALQQCRLRFSGEFNTIPSLGVFDSCENTTQGSMHCYVLPRYDWSCSSSSSDSSSGNIDEDEGSDSWPHSSTKSATKTSTSVVSVFGAGQLCKPHHNPCKNNAICRQVKLTSANKSNSTTTNKLRVQCHCPLGFRGKLCEEDIDECAVTGDNNEQPVCAQSATCINTYGSYICNCSLEPPTLCYNTLSSKFSASVVDLKHVGALRGHTIKNIGGDSSSSGLDQSGNEEYAKLTLLGYSVPVAVVQQALLGIFGGICALLIILSIAAAVVCRVNMSSRRTRSRDHRYSAAALKSTSTTAAVSSGSSSCGGAGSGGLAATTTATESNTSGDHEDLFLSSSASASPGSDAFKHHKQTPSSATATVKVTVEKSSTKQSSKSTNRFKRSTKQRSSMTASLISTHTNDSQYDNTPYNQRKSKSKQQQQQRKQTSKYTINNLLFSTKREEVGGKKSSTSPILELNEMKQPTTAASSSSLAEEETASGGEEAASSSSSSSTYDNSPNRAKMSTSRLSQHQHDDIVETVCLLEKTTNDVNRVENLLAGTTNTASNNNFSSFGRNINKPNGTGSNYAQMKMTQLKRIRVETGADDSMNAEDCSQGYYYWDVTDWTGNEPAEIQINKSLNLSTNSPYSPLYSKVFKVNSSTRDNRSELFEELIQPTTSNGNYDELSNYQVDETTEKLDLIKLRQNYLYLANRDDEVEESETAT